MTNGDRIRLMSNEEFAEMLDKFHIYKCEYCKYHYIKGFSCVVERPKCSAGIKVYLESEEE